MKDTLVNYDYTKYDKDLDKTNQRHPHVVRRDIATTYVDEYALKHIQEIANELPNQILPGWSRSYYLPDKHLEAVLQFGQPNIPVSRIDVDIYRQSIDEAKNRLSSLRVVRAYDANTELNLVSYKPSSAAGYDYVGRKGPIGELNHKRAIKRAKATLMSAIADDGEGIDHVIETMVPDVGYTRTQLADLNERTKVRQVWGRAFHYILLEGLVADPLIRAVMNSPTFIHAGQDPTISVPNLLSTVARDCKWIYALDWKSFDATVSRFEINAAFDIMKSFVQFPNYETEQSFELTRQLFIHKKVSAPDGYIYWTHKGIPSGSYYTSLVGSIINFLRIDYLWRYLLGHPPKHVYTLGDDSLVGDDILLEPERIAAVANDIGWYFNVDKTEYSTIPESVTFLGRSYTGGINARNLTKCIRLLVYPEYPVESGRISAYRAQSISTDAGGLSDVLNRVALRLRREYGVASDEEVPDYFKRYEFII